MKSSEYSIIMYFIIRAFFLGISSSSILLVANQDAWISIIISFFIGLIPLILYYFLLNHDEKLNINGLIDKYFNKYIAFIIKFLLVCTLLFHLTILIWNTGNFISSQFLYKTPLTAINMICLIPILYLASKNNRVIGRVSIVFFIINIFFYILTAILLFNKIDINNIKPIFEYGMNPILNSTINTISYNVLPIFTLLIIPKKDIKDSKKIKKIGMIFYIISFISLFFMIFYTISIFGIKLSLLYEYPEFQILKLIQIGEAIKKMEAIFSYQWFFDIVIAGSVCSYYIKKTVNFNKSLYIIYILVILLSRIIFKNNTVANDFLLNKYKYILIFSLFIIPLIILIKASFFKFFRNNKS